jgi:hypothetical protein
MPGTEAHPAMIPFYDIKTLSTHGTFFEAGDVD